MDKEEMVVILEHFHNGYPVECSSDEIAALKAGAKALRTAKDWHIWPSGDTGDIGEYPPDQTLVEIYCGRWASKDRVIGMIDKQRGTYGPSGASHWRELPAPPEESGVLRLGAMVVGPEVKP